MSRRGPGPQLAIPATGIIPMDPAPRSSNRHSDGGNRGIVPVTLILSGPFVLAMSWLRLTGKL